MSKRRWVTRALGKSLALLPDEVVADIELAARQRSGRGWGAKTVEEEVDAVLSLLPAGVDSDVLALDAGGNVGNWTWAFLDRKPSSTVVAFEPSAAAFSTLRARFRTDSRVRLVQSAVGDHDGHAELWADTPGSGLASVNRRRLDHFGIEFGSVEQVRMCQLDTWSAETGLVPDVIKFDVEGHEMAALRGAQAILDKVSVVQFEFGGCNIDSRTYFQDFFYFFREIDFDIFLLGPRGLKPVTDYTEDLEAFVTTNYFARPSGNRRQSPV